uniref:Uncharacterized protein n=1 Tax=uncultured marine virus TaxID=186617 RepID=S4TEJ2_9VIRU|nr:hypothetical protein [uncultured marine virus]
MALNPTEKCLAIKAAADTSGASGYMIVKASRHLGEMNNRLYRQCRTYDLKFSTISNNVSYTNTTLYDFYTLPNTWFVYGAIKYAYDTYLRAHQDEIDAGIKFGRWHDFIINEQDPDGIWELSELVLYDGDGWATVVSDEVAVDSTVTNEAGTSISFNLLGAESNMFNVFSEYANLLKGRGPADDSVDSDQPYAGLISDLDDADKMVEVGDQAPYDRDFSSFLHDGTDDQNILTYQASISVDPNGATQRTTRTFTAPLGLVWVVKTVNGSLSDHSNTVPELCMHVAPGKYKGVRSESLV